jgi:hypothetical protein
MKPAATEYVAASQCATIPGNGLHAGVCTYPQALLACAAFLNGNLSSDFFHSANDAGIETGWFGDMVGDDMFEVWNEASCAMAPNVGGPPTVATSSLAYRCCY